MKRRTHTNRGGNPQNNLAQLCPFFDLEFLLKNVKHALYISKRNCSRALAPACGALVTLSTHDLLNVYHRVFTGVLPKSPHVLSTKPVLHKIAVDRENRQRSDLVLMPHHENIPI